MRARICSKCGKSNPPDRLFCVECGFVLDITPIGKALPAIWLDLLSNLFNNVFLETLFARLRLESDPCGRTLSGFLGVTVYPFVLLALLFGVDSLGFFLRDIVLTIISFFLASILTYAFSRLLGGQESFGIHSYFLSLVYAPLNLFSALLTLLLILFLEESAATCTNILQVGILVLILISIVQVLRYGQKLSAGRAILAACLTVAVPFGIVGCLILSLATWRVARPLLQGAIIYIDVHNTGVEDGSENHPFNTIQEGIDDAVDGDTVWVSPGTYVENITIRNKSIVLRSLSGSAVTVVDGRAQSSVINIHSTSRATQVTVDGFTIQNGGGKTSAATSGYGIVIHDVGVSKNISTAIRNNIITGNNLRGGIGVIVDHSHFEILIANNRIVDNEACGVTVDVPCFVPGSVVIKNNIIAFNRGAYGGGVSLRDRSFDNCTFTMVNNTIYGNTATYGGGISIATYNPTLMNNILFMNTAKKSGDDLSLPLFWERRSVAATVSFNIIGDGQLMGIDSNFSFDPLLVDPANSDFHLQPGSPAIDAGTTTSVDTDFESDARPCDGDGEGGAQWDIGADEKCP